MREDNKDKQTYELITRWLEAYKISTDKYERAKLKALIVTRMLPIIKKIARTIEKYKYNI